MSEKLCKCYKTENYRECGGMGGYVSGYTTHKCHFCEHVKNKPFEEAVKEATKGSIDVLLVREYLQSLITRQKKNAATLLAGATKKEELLRDVFDKSPKVLEATRLEIEKLREQLAVREQDLMKATEK